MSLKPIKKSEQKKIAAKMAAKKRNTKIKKLPPKMLIVSEGTKTEPHYFEILAEKINSTASRITRAPRVIVQVEGSGRNTSGLYNYIEDNFSRVELQEYKEIWLVYDKDDFPATRFDDVDSKARLVKNSRFHAAWSNESFELWLIWHYQDYAAETHRKEYIKVLKKYVPHYSKGERKIFEKIVAEGNIRMAIDRAKRQEKYYNGIDCKKPSEMRCASNVYKLVEELLSYI